jgi:AraC-like DNA-binding protein
LRLQSSDASTAWLAIITPPDCGGVQGRSWERLQVHTRPRLDALYTGNIATEQEQRGGLPARMLRCIEEYVDVHLEKDLSVEDLASHLGISTSYFARSFRKSVGLAPHAYVMRQRLLRAQELLAGTEGPLADIALATGFADQSHFCRRFHEMTGVPPRTFRLQHRWFSRTLTNPSRPLRDQPGSGGASGNESPALTWSLSAEKKSESMGHPKGVLAHTSNIAEPHFD